MPLPKHLRQIITKNMKTNRGRNKLGKAVGAKFFKTKEGKIKKVK